MRGDGAGTWWVSPRKQITKTTRGFHGRSQDVLGGSPAWRETKQDFGGALHASSQGMDVMLFEMCLLGGSVQAEKSRR